MAIRRTNSRKTASTGRIFPWAEALLVTILAGIVACAGSPALAFMALGVWALAVVEGGW